MNIIEIERNLDILRKNIQDTAKLNEAKVLICKAQNLIQNWIENNYTIEYWQHRNTQVISKSIFVDDKTTEEEETE